MYIRSPSHFRSIVTARLTSSITPTLLISAVAVIEDVNRAVTMDLKCEGDLIYIVGTTYNELGGSHYYSIHGYIGNDVPKVNPTRGKKIMDALSKASSKGVVMACHDLSEGGLGVAAAEMAFAGGLGMTINLAKVPLGESVDRNDTILFSESNTRFLVEIPPEKKQQFEKMLKGISFAHIGEATSNKKLEVYGIKGEKVLIATLTELKEAWQQPLRW